MYTLHIYCFLIEYKDYFVDSEKGYNCKDGACMKSIMAGQVLRTCLSGMI